MHCLITYFNDTSNVLGMSFKNIKNICQSKPKNMPQKIDLSEVTNKAKKIINQTIYVQARPAISWCEAPCQGFQTMCKCIEDDFKRDGELFYAC